MPVNQKHLLQRGRFCLQKCCGKVECSAAKRNPEHEQCEWFGIGQCQFMQQFLPKGRNFALRKSALVAHPAPYQASGNELWFGVPVYANNPRRKTGVCFSLKIINRADKTVRRTLPLRSWIRRYSLYYSATPKSRYPDFGTLGVADSALTFPW